LSEDGASLGTTYRRARKWLKEQHTFDIDGTFNTFELTIRLLGGLLSAHWAEYEVGITPGLHQGSSAELGDDYDPSDFLYLKKAVDLAERLAHAFNTRSGLPLSSINLKTRQGFKSDVEGGLVSTAEVGTIQLEFRFVFDVTHSFSRDHWEPQIPVPPAPPPAASNTGRPTRYDGTSIIPR
jgi:mannosyl-oligosaccharide alpha-1,2-mannosidase